MEMFPQAHHCKNVLWPQPVHYFHVLLQQKIKPSCQNCVFFIDGTHHVATEWKNIARATAKPFRTEDVFQRTHFAAANAFVITLFGRVS